MDIPLKVVSTLTLNAVLVTAFAVDVNSKTGVWLATSALSVGSYLFVNDNVLS